MASHAFPLAVLLLSLVLSSLADDGLGYEIQPGIEIIKQPYTVIAQSNSPLVLNCSVSSTVHTRSVVWKKNENTIIPRGRISVLQNHTLFFRQVLNRRKKGKKRNDEGVYDCYVKNDYGTVLATRIILLIAGIQTSYIQEPESQVAYVGGVASFQCNIKAVPHAVYVWEKDKAQLPNDLRYTTLPSGILQIYNVKKSDVGYYRCRSYHGALQQLPNQVSKFQWRDSSQAKLVVQESSGSRPPRFLSQSSGVKAMAGSTTVLVCIADGSPLPKITWSREDGKKIQEKNMKILVGGSLQLSHLERKDSGNYICSASSGTIILAIISLDVQVEPEILNELPHRAYPQAHVVDFICRYDAVPFPTLTWLFNGKKIKVGSRISIIPKKDGISLLRIIQSQETDSGYYQCFAENSVGYASGLARLKIEVNVKAPNPPRNVTLHTVTMNALNISWQPPIAKPCCPIKTYSVHCSRKSKPGEDKLVEKTFLILKDLEPFTNYSCYVTAYNHFGASGHSNSVSQFTPDATPLIAPQVDILGKTPTSIKIKWGEIPREYRRGVITQYRVYYKAHNRTNMEKFKKPAVREYLITDLMPDTVYHIRLLAGTNAGFPTLYDSDWPWVITRTLNLKRPENNTYYQVSVSASSKEAASIQMTRVFQTSTQANVPQAPQMVIARPISPFAVNLTWDPPVLAAAGANITYTVRWSPISSTNGGNENTFKTNLTTVVIKGLQPYTEYQFSIRSHSGNEKGPFSKLAIARTNEGVPSMPTKVNWLPVGAGKVKVEWAPPIKSNGVVLTYTILYSIDKQSPISSWVQVVQNGSMTSLTLEKLLSKIYYMKMWANTTAGKGSSTKVIIIDITSSPDPTASVAVPPNTTASSHGFTTSHAGIIIGAVLVICILITIFIGCFQHRWCKRQNLALDSHIRSNGHGPNHTNLTGMHELESRTPMLIRLSENENSDAKGGGHLMFTSSGTPINGYRVSSGLNGHIPNGHTTSFIATCLDKGLTGDSGCVSVDSGVGGGVAGDNDTHHSPNDADDTKERGEESQGMEQTEPLLSKRGKPESQSEQSTSQAPNQDDTGDVKSSSDAADTGTTNGPSLSATDPGTTISPPCEQTANVTQDGAPSTGNVHPHTQSNVPSKHVTEDGGCNTGRVTDAGCPSNENGLDASVESPTDSTPITPRAGTHVEHDQPGKSNRNQYLTSTSNSLLPHTDLGVSSTNINVPPPPPSSTIPTTNTNNTTTSSTGIVNNNSTSSYTPTTSDTPCVDSAPNCSHTSLKSSHPQQSPQEVYSKISNNPLLASHSNLPPNSSVLGYKATVQSSDENHHHYQPQRPLPTDQQRPLLLDSSSVCARPTILAGNLELDIV
ncbi:protogenin-like isoform X2 [Octopus sinensis]|uniref:Protogenin-like isoform X2 n=1 Tax=Octopus sinensis TaxID=2607531 RepID=A0A6P7TFC2_9MOLL|nr:protogenin-like isoform X2 [Octopus sinensis]